MGSATVVGRPAAELLEKRALLSGAPVEAHVSFLPARLGPATGYVADSGAAFRNQGSGLSYGWNAANRSVRFHRSRWAPDARYQTYALLPARRASAWEIGVPNGTYSVHLVAGDGTVGSRMGLAAEGVTILSGRTTRAMRWIEATATVTVADGRLTISAAAHASGNKIDFIDIRQVVSQPPAPQPPQPQPPAPQTLTWHQVAPIPVGLTEAMGEVVGGRLYVFGGYTNTTYVPANATFCYDPQTNTWSRRADMPIGSTHTGTAADDRYVYLAGGDPWNASRTAQVFSSTAVWRYDTVSDSFSALPPLPQARGRGALVLLGRELHYVSGCDTARIDRHEHWALNLDDLSAGWVARAPILIARNHPGSAALDGKLYVIGGAVNEDAAESVLSSVEVYDPATDTWGAAPALPTPRALVMSGVDTYDGRILAAGGETAYNVPTNQVTAFDPATQQWTQLTPLPLKRTSGILRNLGGMLIFTTGHPGFNTTTWIGTFG